MKIEEIEENWVIDSKIDDTNLSASGAKIGILHAKYSSIYWREKLLLIKFKAEYKELKLEKYEFLTNPTEEKFKLGWELPSKGRILKQEVQTYLDGDKDLIKFELKIGVQEEKVAYVKSILDSLNGRNYIISNIIADRKFMSGG